MVVVIIKSAPLLLYDLEIYFIHGLNVGFKFKQITRVYVLQNGAALPVSK